MELDTHKTPVQHLSNLVAIPSITGDATAIKKVFDYIEQHLKHLPLQVNRHVNNGCESLVAVTPHAGKSPTLWLVGHVDVTPADPTLFTLKEVGDKLVGRGSLDNKCAAAAFISACEKLGADVQNYDFGIMLTSDEEAGGANGVNFLLNTAGYSGEVAFVPDSGTGWTIESQAKGYLHLRVETTGRAAHGALPWQGESAIDKLLRFINDLRAALQLQSNEDAEEHYLPTLNIGTIQGGTRINQVADRAAADLDLRFPDNAALERCRDAIANLCSRDKTVVVTELSAGSAVQVATDSVWIKKYKKILEKHGITVKYRKSCGTTDARYFAALGIPTIVSQPNGDDVHGATEWIERDGPEKLANVVNNLILSTKL